MIIREFNNEQITADRDKTETREQKKLEYKKTLLENTNMYKIDLLEKIKLTTRKISKQKKKINDNFRILQNLQTINIYDYKINEILVSIENESLQKKLNDIYIEKNYTEHYEFVIKTLEDYKNELNKFKEINREEIITLDNKIFYQYDLVTNNGTYNMVGGGQGTHKRKASLEPLAVITQTKKQKSHREILRRAVMNIEVDKAEREESQSMVDTLLNEENVDQYDDDDELNKQFEAVKKFIKDDFLKIKNLDENMNNIKDVNKIYNVKNNPNIYRYIKFYYLQIYLKSKLKEFNNIVSEQPEKPDKAVSDDELRLLGELKQNKIQLDQIYDLLAQNLEPGGATLNKSRILLD